MLDEEAKAIQETAKTAGKAIDASRDAGGYLKQIFGDAFIDIGGIASDSIKVYRYKRWLTHCDAVREIHIRRQIEGKPLPITPQFAIPIMQAVSLEEDPKIQDLWVGLIANATDPNTRLSLKKRYLRILTDMEPLDAQVLETLKNCENLEMNDTQEVKGMTVSQLEEATDCDQEEIQMSILNLYQMQCIFDHSNVTWKELNSKSIFTSTDKPDARFQISPLGISLLEACKH